MGKEIVFDNVKKKYKDVEIIPNMNFRVAPGERLILLGPSGCGKSTILRMIAGFEFVTEGEIRLDGQVVNDIPSGKRNIAMVFQNYALYPHMTVLQNITYGLKANKVPLNEIKNRVDLALDIVELKGYENRKPHELSGGQRQRVALARAIVKKCEYLLLDEPLSNLDAKLRVSARKHLLNIHEKFGQTLVYVTHDQIEAMTLGQKIVLINEGEIQMFDTPEHIYNRPANVFTAQFIGSPPMSVIEARYENGKMYFGNQEYQLDQQWVDFLKNYTKKTILFGIRPEHLEISVSYMENSLVGFVNYIETQGKDYGIYLQLNNHEIVALSERKNWAVGGKKYIRPMQTELHLFDPDSRLNLGYPETMTSRYDR